MSSKELMLKILKKTMLTPEKVVERTNVNAENFNNLLEKNIELSISDYQKLSEYFKISIGALATGNLDENDKANFYYLKPAVYELVDEFISKCTEIVKKAGFESEINVLVPKAIYGPYRGRQDLLGFEGGIFFINERYPRRVIKNPIRVSVSLTELLKQDNYELFLNISKLVEITDDTKRNRNGIKIYNKFPTIEVEHIKSNSDLRFIKAIDLDNDRIKGEIIYKFSDDNPKYWEIMKILLDKGAYLTKMEPYYDPVLHVDTFRWFKDIPSTLLFIDLVKRKTKG